jgi:molecular chaperone DnaK
MGISVGIDLGTSNSVVAMMTEDGPVVLGDAGGRALQPSVVAFGRGGKPVVGHIARQQLSYVPETTVSSAKRLIGRSYSSQEAQRMRHRVAWAVVEGENGEARLRVGGEVLTSEEIAAHVLTHMVRLAEAATGEKVDGAVITVPAYFNDLQRQATRDAAEIANLKCLRIINEPTAAALAYGFGRRSNQRIVVYDLGGGTFDVSILHVADDLIEVLSTAGDTFLGGDDFDVAIADHFRQVVDGSDGVVIPNTHRSRVQLGQASERIKRMLGEKESVVMKIPGIGRKGDSSVNVEVSLSRKLAKTLTMPLIQRSFVVCDDALAQAKLAPSQIDAVLMVGGMTRFPPVQQAVGQYFNMDAISHINPDEVVAVGAAIQASNLTLFSAKPGPVLLDVTPKTLGIQTIGGFMETMVPRNTAIPTMIDKVFHTANTDQTEVRIRVCQGDSREVRNNVSLGEFVLDGLPKGPRGMVKIRVTFAIDANGIVSVSAADVESGNSRELRIEATTTLSPGQVDELRFDDELTDSVDIEAEAMDLLALLDEEDELLLDDEIAPP